MGRKLTTMLMTFVLRCTRLLALVEGNSIRKLECADHVRQSTDQDKVGEHYEQEQKIPLGRAV